MSLETALRATEILLALVFLQQSAEHIFHRRGEALLFAPRAALSLLLLSGIAPLPVLIALSGHSLLVLHRFAGPYNGGSDRMGLLTLYCLTLPHALPPGPAREGAFGYLAVQVLLSYFISGQVKVINPDWRSGRALQDVFAFSAYPVSEDLRRLAARPALLWLMSWSVMLFELAFPVALLHPTALITALAVAALFHFANACLFGLNRFVWAWLAAYPSILWLQDRLLG